MLAALSTPDTIVAIVCAVAAVRGAVKGFAWQVVRTIGLVGALWGAFAWNERFGAWIQETVPLVPDVASDWVALFVIFLGLLLVATWFAWMAKGALRTVKLGGIDRLLGFVAGAAMGLIVVTAGFLAWGSWVRTETLRDDAGELDHRALHDEGRRDRGTGAAQAPAGPLGRDPAHPRRRRREGRRRG